MDLSGKVVFITGAAQGLGKAYAEALLEQGAKVFFGDVDSTLGTATYDEFKKRFSDNNVGFATFDVTDHQKFKDVFNLAVSTFGHVNVFVNNAGVLNESKWEQIINVNLTAVVFGTKLAAEHMRKDKGGRGGRIINISSVAGLDIFHFIPVYNGVKHAVRAYTTALAQQPDLEEQGVEFGILCPDATVTNLVQSLDNERVVNFDQVQNMIAERSMEIPVVVNAFLELLKLEKMNGAILQISIDGKSYRKIENVPA